MGSQHTVDAVVVLCEVPAVTSYSNLTPGLMTRKVSRERPQ